MGRGQVHILIEAVWKVRMTEIVKMPARKDQVQATCLIQVHYCTSGWSRQTDSFPFTIGCGHLSHPQLVARATQRYLS
ncbi:MAG TPA: hypothetical protein DCE55_09575 [Planctomycetaceae bacterium]|nr:hypothetical protein [Planctomycetaceae bacterium]